MAGSTEITGYDRTENILFLFSVESAMILGIQDVDLPRVDK